MLRVRCVHAVHRLDEGTEDTFSQTRDRYRLSLDKNSEMEDSQIGF